MLIQFEFRRQNYTKKKKTETRAYLAVKERSLNVEPWLTFPQYRHLRITGNKHPSFESLKTAPI